MAAAAASKKLKQQPQHPSMSSEESECLAELAKQFGITDLKLEDLKVFLKKFFFTFKTLF